MAPAQLPPPPPPPSSQIACRLFKLPGELRNRIYREVLAASSVEYVQVTSAGHDRPALLNTCKAIRAEALSIFYHENVFEVTVSEFDSTPLLRMKQAVESVGLYTAGSFRWTVTTCFAILSWKNLLVWLHRLHSEQVEGKFGSPEQLFQQGVHETGYYVLGSLFMMVESLRGTPWKQVEAIVVGMRPTLISVDVKWGED